MSAALQFVQSLFSDPAIVSVKIWTSPNGGEIGVFQSREHVYLIGAKDQSFYMHPYNVDLQEKALRDAAILANIAGAVEVTA